MKIKVVILKIIGFKDIANGCKNHVAPALHRKGKNNATVRKATTSLI